MIIYKKIKTWGFKYSKKITIIFIHCFIWIVLCTFSGLFLSNEMKSGNYLYQFLAIWGIHLALFYLNYFLIIPNIVSRKKRALSIVGIIFILCFSYFIIYNIKTNHSILNKTNKERNINRIEIRTKTSPIKRNNFDHGTAYGIFVFFSLSSGLWFINRWNYSEKEKLAFELTFLKQQLNPHFLFNSLNNLYSLSIQNSPKTTELILELSDFLKYMLYETSKGKIKLNSEMEYLKNYINIERFRITDTTKIDLHIPEFKSSFMIEPLLLLPVVENAFKFGSNNYDQSYIKIWFSESNGILDFQCENKVVNLKPKIIEETGIGLANVRRRLNILYPNNHILRIFEKESIFKVELQIKLKA